MITGGLGEGAHNGLISIALEVAGWTQEVDQ